ncbi:TonB-dependent receptor [Croceicoccus sp. F390]|uniref:TonB-dependent receptor n=1 Tax=Croceicoccus esteveae TaxID=3075597 RepID=A0ABU2ZDD9_9SPHN|nr:TonB-dependent receptor [Croceicoccus sp. F390]MDT0574610.1 TonB-dependent receptor [Croceicoccus sp. F390]
MVPPLRRAARLRIFAAAAIGLWASSWSSAVAAQEIVVTGKQDDTRLADYPGSAITLDDQDLQLRQFTDLSSLSFGAPNVSLDPVGTFAGVANFTIRGLGINSSIPSIDPAVGLFVDGVYMGVNTGTVFDALDVRTVEILRGPQSVLFGRNTTGGAVLVETGDPTFDWQGSARLHVEAPIDQGRGAPLAGMQAVMSGSLSDRLAIRLGALHTSDGGYFRNRFDNRDFGAAQTTVLRAATTMLLTQRLTLTAKGEWHDSSGDGATTQNHGQNSRFGFNLSVDEPGFYTSRAAFAVLRGSYDLGRGKLTNVFGWREYDLRTRNDIDSSPQFIFHSDTGTSQEQFSNDLFWSGAAAGGTLIAGGYFFTQKVAYDEDRSLPALGTARFFGGGRQDHDVYAFYAKVDYPLHDRLDLTAGLRWSREEKQAAITYVRPRPACSVIAESCPTSGINPITNEPNGISDGQGWNSLSPRLALSWQLSREAQPYASWTRGHRSGGYNLRVTQPLAFEQIAGSFGSAAFDEETVDSFEFGFKWQDAGGRASVNAALFWSEVRDLQREISVASQSSGLAQSVYNTADARIRGGEIEGRFALGSALTISANAGHTDADYRKVFLDLSGDGALDAQDRALRLPRVPSWTYGITALAQANAGDATLTARLAFQHRDRYAYTDNNFGYVDPFDSLDASIGLSFADPAIRVTIYGRNLLDSIQFGGDTQLPFAGGAFSDGEDTPFDPRPAAGTFSPVGKGRRLGVAINMDL